MQIPRNDGLSINIHIGCLYINHADLSILDILYSNFFSVPSHAKNHKVGWICCDPAGTSCQCSTAQQYCGKPCVWPSCNMYLFQKDDQRFSVKKNNTFLKVSNKNHVIRMMISKVTPLWFVSFDSFDPETSTNFNPAMLFHRFFSGQRGDESTTIPSWNSRVPTSTPKNWVVGRLLPFWGSA